MIVRDPAGLLKIVLSGNDLRDALARWRAKPETRAMFERMVKERQAFVDKVLAEIKARQK